MNGRAENALLRRAQPFMCYQPGAESKKQIPRTVRQMQATGFGMTSLKAEAEKQILRRMLDASSLRMKAKGALDQGCRTPKVTG